MIERELSSVLICSLYFSFFQFYHILCGPRVIEQPKKEAIKVAKKRFMPLAELSRLANKIKARKRSAKGNSSAQNPPLNSARKDAKYPPLLRDFRFKFKCVKLVNLSISSLAIFGKS